MFGLLRSLDFWNNKTDRVAVTSVLKTELKLFRFRGKHINKRYSPGSPPIPSIPADSLKPSPLPVYD